jgi:hypothetical protein
MLLVSMLQFFVKSDTKSRSRDPHTLSLMRRCFSRLGVTKYRSRRIGGIVVRQHLVRWKVGVRSEQIQTSGKSEILCGESGEEPSAFPQGIAYAYSLGISSSRKILIHR